jgi:NAD(P)H-dependent nitrite reductase small subunit
MGGAPGDWRDETVSPEGWVKVARLEDLPADGAHLIFAGRAQVALFKDQGKLLAVDNRCPHSRGPLSHGKVGRLPNGNPCVTCPWHDTTFDLCSGQALPGGVTKAPVAVYPVRVTDGEVFIQLPTRS